MNSDNYEYAKSSAPQSVSDYSAYCDKQWNSVNDINSGVYNTSGQSLVQFDLSSIYNSNGFCDVSDLYLAIPLVMVAVCSDITGATTYVPPTAGYSLCSLKSNYQSLVHQIEIVANGKVVNDMQPFVSLYKNFKLISELSSTDLQSTAPSFGLSTSLDNERSVQFTTANLLNKGTVVSDTQANVTTAGLASVTGYAGVGLCNNLPFPISGISSSPIAIGQNRNQCNKAIYDRVSKVIDTTATNSTNGVQNIYGAGTVSSATTPPQPSIQTMANCRAEFKSYYTVVGNVCTWYDTALIPLKYLCDCVDKMGLVKKMDMVMRMYLNTGAIQIQVQNANSAVNTTTLLNPLAYGTFTSNFGTTCPLTINYLNTTAALGGIPASTKLITAGLFIGKAPSSIGSISVSLGAIDGHPLIACRCYYSLVQLEPSRAVAYIESNISKEVIYENFLFNQYSNIGVNSSFSQLVQSGIKNPIAICIIPLISASNTFPAINVAVGAVNNVNPMTQLGFSQYGSPYDTCPATYAPISLTNLQVSLGGQNVMNTSMYYTYENFLQQVALSESLTSADIGISAGLVSQSWWEMNRVYYIDLGRSQEADKATTRNLNISFMNNSQVIIDILVYTVYLDRFVLNVLTGQVKK